MQGQGKGNFKGQLSALSDYIRSLFVTRDQLSGQDCYDPGYDKLCNFCGEVFPLPIKLRENYGQRMGQIPARFAKQSHFLGHRQMSKVWRAENLIVLMPKQYRDICSRYLLLLQFCIAQLVTVLAIVRRKRRPIPSPDRLSSNAVRYGRCAFMPFLLLIVIANFSIATAETREEKLQIWASFADPALYPVIGLITAAYLVALRYRSSFTRTQKIHFILTVIIGVISSWSVYFLETTSTMGQIVLDENWKTILLPLLTGQVQGSVNDFVMHHDTFLRLSLTTLIMAHYMRTVANDSVNTRASNGIMEK